MAERNAVKGGMRTADTCTSSSTEPYCATDRETASPKDWADIVDGLELSSQQCSTMTSLYCCTAASMRGIVQSSTRTLAKMIAAMTSLDLHESPATSVLKLLNQEAVRALELVSELKTTAEWVEELEQQVLQHVLTPLQLAKLHVGCCTGPQDVLALLEELSRRVDANSSTQPQIRTGMYCTTRLCGTSCSGSGASAVAASNSTSGCTLCAGGTLCSGSTICAGRTTLSEPCFTSGAEEGPPRTRLICVPHSGSCGAPGCAGPEKSCQPQRFPPEGGPAPPGDHQSPTGPYTQVAHPLEAQPVFRFTAASPARRRRHMAPQQVHMSPGRDHMAPQQVHMSPGRDHMAPQQDPLAPHQDHLAPQRVHMTQQQDHMTLQQDHMTREQDHMATQQVRVTRKQDHMAAPSSPHVPAPQVQDSEWLLGLGLWDGLPRQARNLAGQASCLAGQEATILAGQAIRLGGQATSSPRQDGFLAGQAPCYARHSPHNPGSPGGPQLTRAAQQATTSLLVHPRSLQPPLPGPMGELGHLGTEPAVLAGDAIVSAGQALISNGQETIFTGQATISDGQATISTGQATIPGWRAANPEAGMAGLQPAPPLHTPGGGPLPRLLDAVGSLPAGQGTISGEQVWISGGQAIILGGQVAISATQHVTSTGPGRAGVCGRGGLFSVGQATISTPPLQGGAGVAGRGIGTGWRKGSPALAAGQAVSLSGQATNLAWQATNAGRQGLYPAGEAISVKPHPYSARGVSQPCLVGEVERMWPRSLSSDCLTVMRGPYRQSHGGHVTDLPACDDALISSHMRSLKPLKIPRPGSFT
eukprot:jgi/Botrbrau1/23024/Bobra.136_1s0015.1